MPAVDCAIISAAGVGSRLGLNLPKCLVPVAGRRIIEWQLELLRDVPEVRVVVGFREQEVMDCVRAVRRDVIFVRNPAYACTTTLDSITLAARHLKGPMLILDGDLLIQPESFRDFLEGCRPGEPRIAVAPAHSDDAVYVTAAPDPDGHLWVDRFRRAPRTDLEWTGLAYLDRTFLTRGGCHVYQVIEERFPIRAQVVHSLEVDTPGDLDRAQRLIQERQWSYQLPGARVQGSGFRVQAFRH